MIRTALNNIIPSLARQHHILTRSITTTKADALTRPLFSSKKTAPALLFFNQSEKFSRHSVNGDKDSSLACALIKGVMLGKSGLVCHALTEGANPNQALTDGNYILHYAAERGNDHVVGELLMAGAKVNTPTVEERDTPLHKACTMGNDSVVEQLLQHRAQFTIKNKDGYTPLELAIIFKNLKCAKVLIHKGAPINQLNPISGCTPLMLACREGSYEMASLLIYFGADVNFRGETTSLHLAANDPKILQLLLEHGASKNGVVSSYSPEKEQIGDSALHTASRWGNFESVQLLLKYKYNPHHTNQLHQTPLDVARLQLIAHRINPSNEAETTAVVCSELDRVISLLDIASDTVVPK